MTALYKNGSSEPLVRLDIPEAQTLEVSSHASVRIYASYPPLAGQTAESVEVVWEGRAALPSPAALAEILTLITRAG